jgi:hypothetical protein
MIIHERPFKASHVCPNGLFIPCSGPPSSIIGRDTSTYVESLYQAHAASTKKRRLCHATGKNVVSSSIASTPVICTIRKNEARFCARRVHANQVRKGIGENRAGSPSCGNPDKRGLVEYLKGKPGSSGGPGGRGTGLRGGDWDVFYTGRLNFLPWMTLSCCQYSESKRDCGLRTLCSRSRRNLSTESSGRCRQ